MLREYIQLVQEDAVAQQELSLISQKIIDYLNANPGKVKDGSRVNLTDMGINPADFKSPQVQILAQSGQVNFEPMAKFKQLPDGGYTIDMPRASASTWFADPKTGYQYNPKVADPWDLARSDKANARPSMGDFRQDPRMASWLEKQGHKLQINIPTETITGNMNINSPGPRANRLWVTNRVTSDLKGMRSTIAHELNHHYNALQGMSMADTQRRVNANADRAKFKAQLDAIPPGTDPKTIPNSFLRQAVENRDRLAELVKQEPELQKTLTAATRSGDQAAIKSASERLTAHRQEMAVLRDRLKTGAAPANPKIPTDYHGDAYWRDPVELNSRLQQAVEQMARDVKPKMSNEQIVAMIEKSFLDQNITAEFVDPNKMPKSFPNGEVADKEFRNFLRSSLKTSAPEFQKEALSSALKDPEFRKLFNKAVKFVSQQQTSPVDLSSAAGKASWSARFRAFLTGIPQDSIQKSLLPNTWNSVKIGTTRLDLAADEFAAKVAQAPKTAVTNAKAATGAAFKAGGWLLLGYSIYVEVSDAVAKYQALDPKKMTQDQYRAEVTKIIAQPIARFGLEIVAAIFGAALAGTVASPTVIGVIPAAIIGAGTGFAAAVAANKAFGNTVEQFIDMLVDHAYGTTPPQSPTQNFNTPASASNTIDGFKESAELTRVRKLAGV